MMEKTKDELKELMREEAFKRLSEGEIESVHNVREDIVGRKIEELLMFPIRDEILRIVYEDCQRPHMKKTEKRKSFRDKYDELYRTDEIFNKELTKTAFGKSYANNYDYDASLISSYIFYKTIDISKAGEWYIESIIDSKKGYEYKICKGNGFYFRGDTMNSWSRTLNEYMRLFGNKYLTDYNGREIPKNYKSWEDYLSRPKHYKSIVPDYISSFMKVVYTIGNFALVPGMPVDFNRKRNSKFKDYWDLTLLAIYEYYMGGTEGEWIRSLEGSVIENWLKKSKEPKDQDGWNNFIKENFMGPFVEEKKKDESGNVSEWGRPRELWSGHFERRGLPKKIIEEGKQEDDQFKEFFENATKRIIERSNLIAKALVDKNSKQKRKLVMGRN